MAATAGEGQEAPEGTTGGAVIREKRESWEKELEERKEKESLDDAAYESARTTIVSLVRPPRAESDH